MFEIVDKPGRGRTVVATRAVVANELVFTEPVFVSVRTIMVLNGVVVWRRSRVERLYDELSDRDKSCYRSLHPLAEHNSAENVYADLADETVGSLRKRGAVIDAGDSVQVALTSEKHRMIWDNNGLHYCVDADVRVNRILHCVLFPTAFSLFSGWMWCYIFGGGYVKSIFGAAVLFFAMLGPFTAKLLYFGSQALCLTAARVNHSCLPNAMWQIDTQRAILGDPTGGQTVAHRAEDATSSSSRPKLSLRTTQKVEKGEEFTIDYIPELAHLAALERRRLLEQEYGFSCSCGRCVAGMNAPVQSGAVTEEEEN